MDMTTAPCAHCGAQVGSVHKCSGCKKNMHGFCGTGVGEEGYGQERTCKHCAAAAAGTQGPPAQGRTQGRAQSRVQATAGPAQAATVLGLGAYDRDLDDEEARPNNAAEEQAAKRAKLPTVNPFASRSAMISHRASATSSSAPAPAVATDQTAAEEPAGPMPTLASTERDRQLKMKNSTKSGAHSSGQRKSTEPRISVDTRLREYPGQCFAKVLGNLRCKCCKKDIPVIKSSIDSHIKTDKHISNVKKQEGVDKADKAFAQELTDYFSEHVDEKGANLSPATHLERFHAVRGAMYAGIPMHKLDTIRGLLERAGESMTHSSHMSSYIPKVEACEFSAMLDEISGQKCSLTIDGTRRNGEAIAGVARYCSQDYVIRNRLVLFITTEKNVNGQQLAVLVTNLWMRLSKRVEELTCVARDACSVNHAAGRTLSTTFSFTDDLLCFCHLLSLVGGHMNFPELMEFMNAWLLLVQSSPAARTLFSSLIGVPMKRFSNIRWHSKTEVIIQIGENFGMIPEFLQKLISLDIGDATTNKMMNIYLLDPLWLELSIAAHMDMEKLVTTTIEMEGERLEILLLFSRIEAIRQLGHSLRDDETNRGVLRNVDALIRRNAKTPKEGRVFTKQFAGHGSFTGRIVSIEVVDDENVYNVVYDADDDEEELDEGEIMGLLDVYGDGLHKRVIDALLPAFDYLENRLTGNCQAQFNCEHSLAICRVLRLFDPSYAAEHEATIDAASARELALVIPLAMERGGELLMELERDLPLFIAAAHGFTANHGSVDEFTESVLGWYKNHSGEIGAWAEASLIAFSFTPSSASAERVFSLLKTLFGSSQDMALADYVQGSMMVRYNGSKRGTSL
jgi:hypothetical protein